MSKYCRYPAKVLGCLQNGKITVIVCPGTGLADGGIQTELAAQVIPVDLRMPNSEFDLLRDRASGGVVTVLRKDKICLDCN